MVHATLILLHRRLCQLTLHSFQLPITMDKAINFPLDSKAGRSWLMFSQRATVILARRGNCFPASWLNMPALWKPSRCK